MNIIPKANVELPAKIPLSVWILAVLVAADLGLRGWQWYHASEYRTVAKKLKVVGVHTNGADGISVVEAGTGVPLWAEWDFGGGGKPDTVSYFHEGKQVLDVHRRPGRLPQYEVFVYGKDGKLLVRWADRSGKGSFLERTFVGSDGSHRMEVWYHGSWCSVVERNKEYGLMEADEWYRLRFTNDVWTLVR